MSVGERAIAAVRTSVAVLPKKFRKTNGTNIKIEPSIATGVLDAHKESPNIA